MWGDAAPSRGGTVGGQDTFVFAPPNGKEVIHNFQQGMDFIELNGFCFSVCLVRHSRIVDLMILNPKLSQRFGERL